MRKFYEVGSTPYYPHLDKTVEIVFAKQLDNGNMYFVRYTEMEESIEGYDLETDSFIVSGHKEKEYYDRIFDHHTLGGPELFDSKEDYERYKAQCIAESKARLLKNNFWIRYLYSEFASNNSERIYEEEREALKQIIKEKLGVSVEETWDDEEET